MTNDSGGSPKCIFVLFSNQSGSPPQVFPLAVSSTPPQFPGGPTVS